MKNTYFLRKTLDELVANGKEVEIILKNGYRIKGGVLGWDSQYILLGVNGKRWLVLLHNVSTIVPETPVEL